MRERFSITPSEMPPVFGLRQPSGAFALRSENSRARFLRRARCAEPITADDCRAPRHCRGRVRPAAVCGANVRSKRSIKISHETGHSSSSSFSSSSSTTHPVWTFSRTRRTTRTRTNQFMVPMRVRKQMEALHEPQRRAGILPASVGNADGTEPLALTRWPGRLEACPTSQARCPRYLRFRLTLPLRRAFGVEAARERFGEGTGATGFHLVSLGSLAHRESARAGLE